MFSKSMKMDEEGSNIKNHLIDVVPRDSDLEIDSSVMKQHDCQKSIKSRENYKLVSPDGEWGWLVLIGCFTIHVLLPMLPAFFGLLFPHLIKELQLSSASVAWVYNTAAFMWCIAGFICGPLCSEFGRRPVALVGTFIACLSVILTNYATSAAYIFLSFSFLVGIGGGVAFTVCHLILPHYFDKKRGLAMGIIMCGISVGQFILPLFIGYLQNMYGFKFSNLIFGAFLLHSVVGAALFQPIEWHLIKVPLLQSENEETLVRKETKSVDKTHNSDHIVQSSLFYSKIFILKNVIANIFSSSMQTLQSLKSPKVLMLAFGSGFVMTGYLNFILMLPFNFVSKGFNTETAAYGISFMAASNFVGRLLIPTLTGMSQRQYFVCILQIIGQLMIFSSMFIFCLVSKLTIMIICLCSFGFGIGISTGLYTLVMIAVTGIDNLPCTFGAVSLSSALICITIGPFSGWLRDYTGSFSIFGQFLSVIVLLGAFSWAVLPFILRRENRKRHQQIAQNDL